MNSDKITKDKREVKTKNLKNNIIQNVSLICTVYNEAHNIEDFLNSIFSMNQLPSEIVIVDGGSSDSTGTIIKNYFNNYKGDISTRLIIDDKCNIKCTPAPIARGRNVAITNASNEIIATTDAGCTLDNNWFYKITEPLVRDNNIDVVSGWYIPDSRSSIEKLFAIVMVTPIEKVSEDTFIPSSRSFAFKKSAWEKVGGYPENSYWGEDTFFVLNLRKAGFKFSFINEAIVHWRMRTNIFSFIKTARNYGYGDGFNNIMFSNVIKNTTKVAIGIILLTLGIFISPYFLIMLLIYWWFLPFYKRFKKALELNNIMRFPIISILKIISDITYIFGYIHGKLARPRKNNFNVEK